VEKEISAAVLVKDPMSYLHGRQLLHPLGYMHTFFSSIRENSGLWILILWVKQRSEILVLHKDRENLPLTY
jgi:hypothetical protein